MAEKIAVESGNPYRDNKGRLATSPNKALDASFAALKGKTFVPKGGGKKGDANKDAIAAKKKEAESKLAAFRSAKPSASKNKPTFEQYAESQKEAWGDIVQEYDNKEDFISSLAHVEKRKSSGKDATYNYTTMRLDDIEAVETSNKDKDIISDVKDKVNPPIIVDENGRILDGHHRFIAYKEQFEELQDRYNKGKTQEEFDAIDEELKRWGGDINFGEILVMEQVGDVDDRQDGDFTLGELYDKYASSRKPTKEVERKISELRSGLGTSDTSWKASGTQEEVDAFAKDSAIQDTLLHGTNSSAQSSITSEGFTVGTAIDERIFGEGVYLTNSNTSAEFYAGRAGGDSSNVLSMKINVKNPYIDKGGYDHKVGKYGVSKYTKDFYDWGVANKHWRNPEAYEKKTDSSKNYNKFTAMFSEHLLETHDAIVKYDNGTDYIAIVKDPKNIMVVNDGK